MIVFLEKGTYKGTVDAIGSKSFAHRYLIASFLNKTPCKVSNVPGSKDIEATLNCIKALGGKFNVKENEIEFLGRDKVPENPVLDCIESGSTLRFFIPIALALTKEVTFKGTPRLIERGIGVYEKIMKEQEIEVNKSVDTIKFKGKFRSGFFDIDGSISSQFVTGLLFALPLLEGDSIINLIPPVNSRNYIDISLQILDEFQIMIENLDNNILVAGNQKYKGKDSEVEGDYSNSAFLEAFNYFESEIDVKKLNPNSKQGDRVYLDLFKKLNESYQTIDVSNCIDLSPVLFVFAALKNGATFTGTSRLAIKESNRAEAVQEELKKIGIDIKVNEDSVEILQNQLVIKENVSFSSHNDHRIAMALSLVSSLMNIEIEDYEAVNKSYPQYFKELEKLGGKIRYE